MEEYNIRSKKFHDGVLVDIQNGMYGLTQACFLAYIKLIKYLPTDGNVPTGHTPGIFHHTTRTITFCLIVYDFVVKCVGT